MERAKSAILEILEEYSVLLAFLEIGVSYEGRKRLVFADSCTRFASTKLPHALVHPLWAAPGL